MRNLCTIREKNKKIEVANRNFSIRRSVMALASASSPTSVPIFVLSSARGSTTRRGEKQARQRQVVVNKKFGHLFEVVRKDVEFLKKNVVTKGIDLANVVFQIPKVSKALDHLIWLRNLEDPHLEMSPSWPLPSYPELSGMDLFMADLKALDAYTSYFHYHSKVWSKPLPRVYDPQEVADYFSRRPHLVALRLLEVFFSFTSAVIRIRTSRISNFYRASMANDSAGDDSEYNFGIVLKETMLDLGPTFIKVGQSLSTRPDIIGTEISKALSELHDQIPPFPRSEAMKIIEEELDAPVESFFSYMSEEPVAAASFGQVYKGRTLDGVSVAVKVQRPNLRHVVVRDVYILRLGLGIWQRIAKRKNDPRLYADELGKGLVGELDYNLEAANASEFLEAHSRYSFISVPKVFLQLTRERVLTMEWMVGENPNDLLYASSENSITHGSLYTERHQYDAKRRLLDLVNKGVEASLVQLLETGLLHADPHPGNLRYTPSGQMGFLDFGLLCRMEKKHQFAMLASIVHIVNGDWALLVHALVDMDVVKPGINMARITMDLEDALGDVEFKDGIPDVKFSKVLGKIWSIAIKYHLRMPPYYTLVLRSLASLEGLAMATDPNYKTFEAAYPYVVGKLLTDNSAETRRILHSVVFNKKKEFQWKKFVLFLRVGGTRKSLHHLVASDSETFLNHSPNGGNVYDVASLVLRLLPSKNGVVMRRLLMTADGASLIRALISDEGSVIRQQVCKVITDALHQWILEALGKITILSKYSSHMFTSGPDRRELGSLSLIHDYQFLVRDRRLKVIFFKILESTRKDPLLMLRFCWASLMMFVAASALASHRVLVSLSENIGSVSFVTKRFAIST